jgi:hypothetical protein
MSLVRTLEPQYTSAVNRTRRSKTRHEGGTTTGGAADGGGSLGALTAAS